MNKPLELTYQKVAQFCQDIADRYYSQCVRLVEECQFLHC